GAGPKDDVLGLDLELRGDCGLQIAFRWCAVERIASGLGELAQDGVERRAARAERVLVAADPDLVHAGRQQRPRALPLRLRLGEMRFEAAGGQERTREPLTVGSRELKEPAS